MPSQRALDRLADLGHHKFSATTTPQGELSVSMPVRWQPSSAHEAFSGRAGTLKPAPGARAIGVWLWSVAALVFAMVLVGGATRLTESGLSIVEWKPVTGVIPPVREADWQAEFAKYKTIPQYERLNRGMSLGEFKTIYWWEWGHRLLGRVIGAAFLLPFLWFLWRRSFDRRIALALGSIFALGTVQGAVGWWMVTSGLTERVSVSQYRLAFHLTLACIIYAALVWTADRTLHASATQAGRRIAVPRRLRWSAGALVVFAIVQIYLGALVAGLRAGLIFNTWPLIDGGFVPSTADLFFAHPLWRNFFENTLTVQFDHRMVAYGLCALALIHAVDARLCGRDKALATGAGLVAAAVLAQASIGIATLMWAVPIELALSHQAVALVVLTGATLHAARTLATPPLGEAAKMREEPVASTCRIAMSQ
jgi:cytochrome c oxidase assembly protein subunit 15